MAERGIRSRLAARWLTPGRELGLVIAISLAVLVPGIWSYTLVDPWETHYGEVARNMLANHDYVHMDWPGATYGGSMTEYEGFRSKPVLTFWLMAAGMHATGIASDGGYSGELTNDARTMVALRLPIVLCAVFGLVIMWWMLARLCDRRLAWLALLVVGSSPLYCLIAREGIPDMPLVATTIGALALFMLAVEDGDRAITRRVVGLGRRTIAYDARHIVFGLAGGIVVIQAQYYAIYFTRAPHLALQGVLPFPNLWLPGLMLVLLAAQWHRAWSTLWFPVVVIARLIVRVLVTPIVLWRGEPWAATRSIAEHLLRMRPITTMRQVYLIACYSLLGIGVLAKGPPGLAVVGGVGVFHVILFGRWRELYDGGFELKRGVLLMIATFLPWHIAMYLKDGLTFLNEYLFTHLLNRAAVGSVDNSPGTFEYYTSQIGHGMWLWAALLPAALAAACLRTRTDTREGRVRFMVALWAIVGTAFFGLVQTKFHHYILPVVPAFGILVAFLLSDLASGRERLHPLYGALAIGIVLIVCRDLTYEPERWIEMFVFRYDRPWPSGEPWQIDVSDAMIALGVGSALAVALLASPWRRLGVLAVGIAGLAICSWSLFVYMPIAGTHWGMGDAIRTYYKQRTVYGERLVYYGSGELYDEWHAIGDLHRFDTVIPDALVVGQPMTITIQVNKPDDPRVMEQTLVLVGTATTIGDHSVEITLAPGERAKLEPIVQRGKSGPHGQPPLRLVDADRLIAWQLYWRGEQFWTNGEVWGPLPELKTCFPNPNGIEYAKYMADRERTPLGRRYFIVTEAGRALTSRPSLPTQRARDSFELLDQTSNKFWLVAFTL